MIRLDGIHSILESLYLEEPLTSRLSDISIEINPPNLRYLTRKTVIINRRDYVLDPDQGYGNTVITRVRGVHGAIYVPYLPVILPGVMWNGMIVDSPEEALDSSFYDNGTLYFPKIHGYTECRSDLDYLGFLEYQVGYNFFANPHPRDLDILKCREGLWEI